MSGTQLDAQGLITLAKGLPDNTTLTKLYMAGTLRVEGVTTLRPHLGARNTHAFGAARGTGAASSRVSTDRL